MGAMAVGGTFKGNFDLTIVNHVEPLDYMQYANTAYYWGYDSKAFRDLAAKHAAERQPEGAHASCSASMQKMLATDCGQRLHLQPGAGGGGKKGLKGLWASSPIFANDMAAVSWQ